MMSKFKKFMRDFVAFVWWLIIGVLIAYKTRGTLQGKGNFGGDLLYLCGLVLVTTIFWAASSYFIVWLTDGTWENKTEEEESE